MLSPSPVPLPSSLVVKNGSKARAMTSGDMPAPVSLTATSGRLHDQLTLHRRLGRNDLAIGRAHVFRGALRQEITRCQADLRPVSFGGPSLGGAGDATLVPL